MSRVWFDSKLEATIWLAGFFEADGCVDLCDTGSGSAFHMPKVSVGQKAKIIMEVIQADFGGRLYFYKAGYGNWGLAWQSRDEVQKILTSLLPHLRFKYEEAFWALEICKYIPDRGKKLNDRDALIRLRLEDKFEEASRFRKEELFGEIRDTSD